VFFLSVFETLARQVSVCALPENAANAALYPRPWIRSSRKDASRDDLPVFRHRTAAVSRLHVRFVLTLPDLGVVMHHD